MFNFVKYFKNVNKRIDKVKYAFEIKTDDLKDDLKEHEVRIKQLEQNQEQKEE